MSTEEWRPPAFGGQDIGQDDGGLLLYFWMGIMAVLFVPLAILSAPVWLPLVAIGWLVVKAMNRLAA